ncbi:MAG: sulfur carrier protein ThiS adenylyltransferase ThiF [Chloroflexota bacterium]|nr:sulfur carrier protein ThiS adenylyltransferase ThiF [Lentimicrobium sp.]
MELTYVERVRAYLKKFTIGIAGCGGLGSTCAINLARAGVGKLVIADFDIVTRENLERQYYFNDQIGMLKVHALKNNIHRVDPSISVKAFDLKLCSSDVIELFAGCDVIVEAFDKAEMKQMIIETVHNNMPNKPLIAGIGLAGWGMTDILKVQRVGNLIICGDQCTEIGEKVPLTAPRVGIVSNMEANEVLNILMSKFEEINEDNAE